LSFSFSSPIRILKEQLLSKPNNTTKENGIDAILILHVGEDFSSASRTS